MLAHQWITFNQNRARQRSTWGQSFKRCTPCMFESIILSHRCIFDRTTHVLVSSHAAPSRRRRELQPSASLLARPPHTLLATDGSFSTESTIFPEHDHSATSGAVVLMEETPPYQVLAAHRFELPSTKERAFTAEVLAISFASHLYSGQILSDCQAAINALTTGKQSYSGVSIVDKAPGRVVWTRSHPERRREIAQWTSQDHAIYEADQIPPGGGSLYVAGGISTPNALHFAFC